VDDGENQERQDGPWKIVVIALSEAGALADPGMNLRDRTLDNRTIVPAETAHFLLILSMPD
jgi:hypothetical protein